MLNQRECQPISMTRRMSWRPGRDLWRVAQGDTRVPKLAEGGAAIHPDGSGVSRTVDEEGEVQTAGTFSGVQVHARPIATRGRATAIYCHQHLSCQSLCQHLDEATGNMMTYQLFVEEDEAAEVAARGGAAPKGYVRADPEALSGATVRDRSPPS